MRYFSLDTNFVLALINDKDRLHSLASSIAKNEKKDCALCKSVINEAKKVTHEKINRAVAKSLDIIVDIRDITDDEKRNMELKKRFDILIEKDTQLKNFYLFLHDKIVSYIANIGVRTLPTYLSNLSENVTRTLEPELQKIIQYSYIKINFSDDDMTKRLSQIKKYSSSVHFKDSIDYQIFCEIVLHLSMNFMIDFYTDDKEFSNKSKRAYRLIKQKLDYDLSWLNIIYYKQNS